MLHGEPIYHKCGIAVKDSNAYVFVTQSDKNLHQIGAQKFDLEPSDFLYEDLFDLGVQRHGTDGIVHLSQYCLPSRIDTTKCEELICEKLVSMGIDARRKTQK